MKHPDRDRTDAPLRAADRKSCQRRQPPARGEVPAPAIHPARPVRLQFSRDRVPDIQRAACVGRDPELWFSDSRDDIVQAKAICGACPDQSPCLSGAIKRRETYGIWGATDFNPAHRQEDVA
jgi:WhiB family transcriptional regulator, redox-sensing transcriptional regulator